MKKTQSDIVLRKTFRTQTSFSINTDIAKYSFMQSSIKQKRRESTKPDDSSDNSKQIFSFRQLSNSKIDESIFLFKNLNEQSNRCVSQKVLQINQTIKKGEIYKTISPKVDIIGNQVKVNFTTSLNRYSQSSEKMNRKSICVKDEQIQEVRRTKVEIKQRVKLTPSQELFFQSQFKKGLLSNYQNLFSKNKSDQKFGNKSQKSISTNIRQY